MYDFLLHQVRDRTVGYFFFGHYDWLDIVGWHISVFLTAIITWQLAKIYHHRKDKA